MSRGTWNIMSGMSSDEEGSKRSNVWLREASKNYNKLTAGREVYSQLVAKNNTNYDPYTSSGGHLTGHQSQQTDAFGASDTLRNIEEAHGTRITQNDALTSAVAQHIQVDERTGVTSLSEDLYGKVDYGPDGKSFVEMGLGLAGSVMDQFANLNQMNSYNPSGYAADGTGFTQTNGGLFAGHNTNAWTGGVGSSTSERRDQFGNVIQTEGVQDYVWDGAQRYNLDFAGNRTATDAFGNASPSGNDVNSFYASTGWNSESSSWNGGSMASFYGTEPAATNGWNQPSSASSIYASYTAPEQNNGNIWGNPIQEQNNGNIFASYTPPAQETSNNFWGHAPSDTQQTASSIYGTSPSNDYNSMASFYGHKKNDWA